MKILFLVTLLLSQLTANAETTLAKDYSGVWKDAQEQLYSIHQSDDVIVMAELSRQHTKLSPFIQGQVHVSGLGLDLAIMGYGFFVIELNDGSVAYTRNGKFFMSTEGRIVDANGNYLVTEKKRVLPYSVSSFANTAFKSLTEDNSECFASSHITSCTSYIEETAAIVISEDGVIKIRDLAGGKLVELDRVVLASIRPKYIAYAEEYFLNNNPDGPEYFFPAETANDARLMQGWLESHSDDSQDWLSFSGVLTDNVSILKSFGKAVGYWKEISFSDDTTAVIEVKCSEGFLLLCSSGHYGETQVLTKIF